MLRKVALVALMLAIQAITGIGAGVLFAQNVTGQVVSASDQEPLIGASVKVEGLQASSTSLTAVHTVWKDRQLGYHHQQ